MPKDTPTTAFRAVRAAILELDDDERAYLRRWLLQYVNRWGQIPVLASDRASQCVNPRWGAAGAAGAPDPQR
jgi:hypothetical protein